MTIWKWRLSAEDIQHIEMPAGAKILSVQVQDDAVCIWAVCDPTAPPSTRRIAIVGTGNAMPEGDLKYISTFQLFDGALVFHAFEVLNDR